MAKTGKQSQKSTVTRKSSAKPAKPAATVGEVAAMNRRDSGRRANDRRKATEVVIVERRQLERREKVNRRRQIDPTTCEREYTPAEIEFMAALDLYKRTSGRMFPTCSEVLEVLISLGYEKRGPGAAPALDCAEASAPAQ